MISYTELKVLDINSKFYGVTPLKLMESAGKGVATFINSKFEENKKIIFICGLGNNGGDGFVAARYLSENHQVNVFLIGNENNIDLDFIGNLNNINCVSQRT